MPAGGRRPSPAAAGSRWRSSARRHCRPPHNIRPDRLWLLFLGPVRCKPDDKITMQASTKRAVLPAAVPACHVVIIFCRAADYSGAADAPIFMQASNAELVFINRSRYPIFRFNNGNGWGGFLRQHGLVWGGGAVIDHGFFRAQLVRPEKRVKMRISERKAAPGFCVQYGVEVIKINLSLAAPDAARVQLTRGRACPKLFRAPGPVCNGAPGGLFRGAHGGSFQHRFCSRIDAICPIHKAKKRPVNTTGLFYFRRLVFNRRSFGMYFWLVWFPEYLSKSSP